MKFLSLDIETSGLNPKYDQVLQVGAIVWDTQNPLPRSECPTYDVLIKHKAINGQPYALQMNNWILRILAGVDHPPEGTLVLPPVEADIGFTEFINDNFGEEGRITVAGKNVASFDLPFMKSTFGAANRRFRHRVIDVGPMYLMSKDETVPDLATCLDRVGLEPTVTHLAPDDAWQVIQLVHFKLTGELI